MKLSLHIINRFENKPASKHLAYTILVLIIFSLTSCDKYEPHKTIEGTYYPNGIVHLEGRQVNWVRAPSSIYVTISQPIRIIELGEMTYGWEIAQPGWKAEVAIMEFSDASVYMVVDRLTQTGSFEYRDREPTINDWIRHNPITTFFLSLILVILIVVTLFKKHFFSTSNNRYSSSYSSSSYSTVENSNNSYTNNVETETKGNRIIGHAGQGDRVNPKTGYIQKEGLINWENTNKRIDPETGDYQKEGLIDWKDTGTRIDQETGIIQKEGFISYENTDTKINPDTGIVQKEGFLGWENTGKRINPKSGKSQHEGLIGWEDD